jgi:hypothetical protein
MNFFGFCLLFSFGRLVVPALSARDAAIRDAQVLAESTEDDRIEYAKASGAIVSLLKNETFGKFDIEKEYNEKVIPVLKDSMNFIGN